MFLRHFKQQSILLQSIFIKKVKLHYLITNICCFKGDLLCKYKKTGFLQKQTWSRISRHSLNFELILFTLVISYPFHLLLLSALF